MELRVPGCRPRLPQPFLHQGQPHRFLRRFVSCHFPRPLFHLAVQTRDRRIVIESSDSVVSVLLKMAVIRLSIFVGVTIEECKKQFYALNVS